MRALAELGYTDTTVAQITRRARISRRTFYELFANREECLIAVLDSIVAQIETEIATINLSDLPWRERVRMGLWAILSFLDREPALASVCIVQALQGGPAMLAHREAILARLAGVLDEGRRESNRASELTVLTAEGLVGAAFTVLYTRLLRSRSARLTDLHSELLGMIVLPYLGVTVARQEQNAPAPSPLLGTHTAALVNAPSDPLDGVPMRLTYRTARVLECAQELPGASNREIGDRAGINDQGQVSKLLSRLERLGLLSNRIEGHLKGEPNAWALTSKGELVAQSIHMHLPAGRDSNQRRGGYRERRNANPRWNR